VIVDDIVIDINYKGIKGTKKIKKVLHDLILTGIKKCVDAAIKLANLIVPESAARPGRYGESYISEKLMLQYISFLSQELVNLSIGKQSLRDHYLLGQKWAASYAEYVNFMTGNVDWSKSTSEAKFIETLDDFLRDNMATYIQQELDAGAPQGVKLTFSVN
jgi:hypothetical protein